MKLICVIGTRPEVIKMAPVIKKLKNYYEVTVVSTGQHKELLEQTLKVFGLASDIDLGIMRPDQSITDVLSESTRKLADIFKQEKPELVLAQGDTTTALAAAQASYFSKIPFAHVEAGLRTYNFDNPWPEEMNRVLISRLADFHFCPTLSAKENLIKEGYSKNIYVTGNTVIDSLLATVSSTKKSSLKTILCTVHRRENFGEPLEEITDALLELVSMHEDIEIILPVHPNPNVKNLINSKLHHDRIILCEPMDYKSFCDCMNNASIILTDSGGVQEEAPALGKPVLVLRDFTERPEAIELGVVKLIGTKKDSIIKEVSILLDDDAAYKKMAIGISPYGDGKASERILAALKDFLRTYKFTEIYKNKSWGPGESVSGAGSSIEYTAQIRTALPTIFNEFKIQSLFDAPCGDFNWMKEVIIPSDINYLGGDIVKELIIENKKKFNLDRIQFQQFDITTQDFPNADLWICRDCFIHLSYEDILLSLKNFCKSEIKYLLTTTHINNNRFENSNIESGGFRFIDLFSKPFSFPKEILYRFNDFNPPYKPAEMILLSREQISEIIENFEANINGK